MFSKKAAKIDEIFTVDFTLTTHYVKSSVKILSNFVAFWENINFIGLETICVSCSGKDL